MQKKNCKENPVQCFVISFLDRLSLGAINNKFVCSSPKYVWIFYTKMIYQLVLMQNYVFCCYCCKFCSIFQSNKTSVISLANKTINESMKKTVPTLALRYPNELLNSG